MADYLNVVYDKKIRPINKYPGKLIDYLINRYKLKKGLKLLEPGLGRGEFLLEFKKKEVWSVMGLIFLLLQDLI